MMSAHGTWIQSPRLPVGPREAHIRRSAGEQIADRRLIVRQGRLQPGRAIEQHAERRLSARLSIAIIAGLSTALWLAVAALMF